MFDAMKNVWTPEQAAREANLEAILKGEEAGHPFRGNQYTEGGGEGGKEKPAGEGGTSGGGTGGKAPSGRKLEGLSNQMANVWESWGDDPTGADDLKAANAAMGKVKAAIGEAKFAELGGKTVTSITEFENFQSKYEDYATERMATGAGGKVKTSEQRMMASNMRAVGWTSAGTEGGAQIFDHPGGGRITISGKGWEHTSGSSTNPKVLASGKSLDSLSSHIHSGKGLIVRPKV